jgi:feruloyl esterase
MFMGWQDPVGAPAEAINYYQAIEARSAAETAAARRKDTQAFLRLFMVPGMGHCAGGPGATHFSTATRDSEPPVSDPKHDMARALEAWVETGAAPDTLIATHFESPGAGSKPATRTIAFQRPLCAYPRAARYNGGPASSADSFSCVTPKP